MVVCNPCKGARRKCNDANDNGGLRCGLGLDFEGKFHASSNSNVEDKKGDFRKRVERVPVQKEGIQGQCQWWK
jgi:hypothetical protein